jgi:hypothetical protein
MALDKDSLADNAITAAGGWCAPTDALYSLDSPGVPPGPEVYDFPKISVARGAPDFTDRRTDAEKIADEAMWSRTRRIAEQLARARHAVIERAAITALHNHWDLHVWEPRNPINLHRLNDHDIVSLSYIGIGFEPGALAIPVIHYHRYDDGYEYMWDWDEEDY